MRRLSQPHADNEGWQRGKEGAFTLGWFISPPHLPAPTANCNHKRQMGRDLGEQGCGSPGSWSPSVILAACCWVKAWLLALAKRPCPKSLFTHPPQKHPKKAVPNDSKSINSPLLSIGDFPLTPVGAEGKTVGLVTQAQT